MNVGKIDPKIDEALTKIEENYFQAYRTLLTKVERASNIALATNKSQFTLPKPNYPMDAQAWSDQTRPQVATFFDLLLAAAEVSEQRTLAAHNDALMWLVWIVGLMISGLLVAAGCGYFVVRRVTRPIDQLSSIMQRLAKRELDVQVPGTERRDELGAMARAVEVFKQNTLAKDRLEAEADARAAAAKAEADLRNTELQFQEELAALIDSAAAGDLSRRIDLTGKSGLMLKLGEGMNRWAETIKVALGEVLRMMSALAQGDLSIRVTGEYEADLLQLQKDTNATADKLAPSSARRSTASAPSSPRPRSSRAAHPICPPARKSRSPAWKKWQPRSVSYRSRSSRTRRMPSRQISSRRPRARRRPAAAMSPPMPSPPWGRSRRPPAESPRSSA
jgi:HAMP domain-containing protein